MEKKFDKPFYLLPPWNILFNPEFLERVNPWDIDLTFLLSSFLYEMQKRGMFDFRASGVALDSSATVYLMKSRLLLELEKPPNKPEPKDGFIPPPLILPIRYELTTTTIQNLLQALEEALKTEKFFTLRAPLKDVLPQRPEVIPVLSVYLMEIEEQMENLMMRIRLLTEKHQVISFSELVKNMDLLEKIRIFIIILFLAHKNRVNIWQVEGSDEIFITPVGERGGDEGGTTK
ncbi:MAG: hypothetical protein RMJ07_04790 [Nitrososphaerota archaeon]|nr:hypothetical protein [Candidatus Bathyarchaeota archaeon]MDW8048982.1 hypothetical protein [Nitrososphaerota archaeon]